MSGQIKAKVPEGIRIPDLPLRRRILYPLEGICNIRFLHKIRIFRGFRVKTKPFSIAFADFTASPERVAPLHEQSG